MKIFKIYGINIHVYLWLLVCVCLTIRMLAAHGLKWATFYQLSCKCVRNCVFDMHKFLPVQKYILNWILRLYTCSSYRNRNRNRNRNHATIDTRQLYESTCVYVCVRKMLFWFERIFSNCSHLIHSFMSLQCGYILHWSQFMLNRWRSFAEMKRQNY